MMTWAALDGPDVARQNLSDPARSASSRIKSAWPPTLGTAGHAAAVILMSSSPFSRMASASAKVYSSSMTTTVISMVRQRTVKPSGH
jgi:hypothetical protein